MVVMYDMKDSTYKKGQLPCPKGQGLPVMVGAIGLL
jgi:hypothetical protein